MADITNLSQFLSDVADSIRSKTGGEEIIYPADFDTEINNIDTVNNENKTITENGTYVANEGYTGLGTVTVNVEDETTFVIDDGCYFIYGSDEAESGIASLLSYITPRLDTSNVTNMYGMFYYGGYNLTGLDVSSFDTSNVTNMGYMFHECYNLSSLNLNNFDTTGVTNMAYMFNNCRKLATLDVSKFSTNRVTTMAHMFGKCESLISLDLSSFTGTTNTTETDATGTASAKAAGYMFCDCSALQTLDISGLDWRHTNGWCFYNCSALETVYVKDEDSKTACDTALSNAGLSITSTIKE